MKAPPPRLIRSVAKRPVQPRVRSGRAAIQDDPSDPRHGTTNGYKNQGCRCERCRKANTDYMRGRRHQLGLALPMDTYRELKREQAIRAHELGLTMFRKGCGCERCNRYEREAKKRWREQNPEKEREQARRRAERRRLRKLWGV